MRVSRGQSVSEYSICIAAIILALAVMQVYVKRGLQGRYADVVDRATQAAQAPAQYEPYYQQEGVGVSQDTNIEVNVGRRGRGTVERAIIQDTVTRNGEIVDLVTRSD